MSTHFIEICFKSCPSTVFLCRHICIIILNVSGSAYFSNCYFFGLKESKRLNADAGVDAGVGFAVVAFAIVAFAFLISFKSLSVIYKTQSLSFELGVAI
uniref:Uncharacterized protein n=1 Tax=viral metagenome TaxID=1070528 RepID=A0A6C0HM87_9ZZZZ